MATTLRLLPKGNAAVTDYAAMKNHVNGPMRKLGWVHDPNVGPKVKDPRSGQMVGNGAYRRLNDQVIVIDGSDPHYNEYFRHLRGDPRTPGSSEFWPADEATAQAAGIKFDPTFGDEHPESAKAFVKEAPPPVTPDPKNSAPAPVAQSATVATADKAKA